MDGARFSPDFGDNAARAVGVNVTRLSGQGKHAFHGSDFSDLTTVTELFDRGMVSGFESSTALSA